MLLQTNSGFWKHGKLTIAISSSEEMWGFKEWGDNPLSCAYHCIVACSCGHDTFSMKQPQNIMDLPFILPSLMQRCQAKSSEVPLFLVCSPPHPFLTGHQKVNLTCRSNLLVLNLYCHHFLFWMLCLGPFLTCWS